LSTEANKRVVQRFVDEVIVERNGDVIDELANGEFARAAKRWVSPSSAPFPTSR